MSYALRSADLVEIAHRASFAEGQAVFREGEVGNTAYVIEKGAVEITSERNGEPVVLARLAQGDLFGEMALIDAAPRSATAIATEDSELVEIHRSYFLEKRSKADPILNLFLRVVLDRFRRVQSVLLEQGSELTFLKTIEVSQSEYLEEERQRVLRKLNFEQEIREAIEREQLALHYQPIVELATGALKGFEALMRWHHPERGAISPGRFIPAAEECGLIVPMGEWAIYRAGEALGRFNEMLAESAPGRGPLFMSVNVSGRQLSDERKIERLTRVVADAPIDPAHLKLEITESLLMDDPQLAAEALRRLKDLGVRIAVDDFGTGYSSLGYLHQFPLDTLKIDRSFVTAMLGDQGSMKVVRAIASLAKDLDMDLIAEGVETHDQMEALVELGSEGAQGYLFSPPRSAEVVESELLSQASLTPPRPA